MNISNTQALAAEGLQGLQGTRGLAGMAGASPLAASGAPESGEATAFFQSGNPAAYTGLQTAASYVQVTSGLIGRMGDLLHQMAGASVSAQNETGDAKAGANTDFMAAQVELRAVVGGPSDEAGGSSGTSSQGAAFDGSELFGPASGSTTVATGVPSQPSIALGSSTLNLRQGAILSLIRQDPSGAFMLRASSPGASAAISGALQQADAASGAVSRMQAKVGVASAEMQVGEANAASTGLTPSQAVAASATAASAIQVLRGAAAGAYSGLPSASSIGLLQAV